MTQRTFEYSEGTSSKFWTIMLDGNTHTVNFGRIGTAGQTQTKEFASASEAEKSASKLAAEKVRKGYVEKTSGTAASASTAASAPAAQRVSPPSLPTEIAAIPVGDALRATAPAVTSRPAPVTKSAEATPPLASATKPEAKTAPIATAQGSAPVLRRSLSLEPTVVPELAGPVPFDRADALNRLRTRVRVHTAGWKWDFSKALPLRRLGPEEAEFWLRAITSGRGPGQDVELVAKQLETQKLTGHAPETSLLSQRDVGPEALQCLIALYSAEELRRLILDPATGRGANVWYSNGPALRAGFCRYVLPYLAPEEIARWQSAVRDRWDATKWPADFYLVPPPFFHFGALLGFRDEIRALVESWSDNLYVRPGWDHAHYHRPQEIVFGLGDSALVAHHFRRLSLPLGSPDYMRRFLALTQFSALDVVAQTIASCGKREEAEILFVGFELVHAPEAAPYVLDLMFNSKAPKLAREWLEQHPAEAAAGLLPVAAGTGKLAAAAVEFLRSLKRRGLAHLVAAQLDHATPEVAARIRELVLDAEDDSRPVLALEATPVWWHEALAAAPLKKSKPIAWIVPTDLPPLVFDEHALGPEHVVAVLGTLQASTLEQPHPLVRALRTYVTRDSLDAFGWKLFELWLGDGAPSKEKWAFQALGWLGGEQTVLRLAPRIREWPGEAQHQRAVAGLDVLRAIGTDTALMQINGIAQKAKFKGLKERAVQCMDAIAEARGMSRSQLEDRIVPDCGLDERGARIIDFGPRSFRFVLGPEMKPMLRYPDGSNKPDLPKPNAKDDAAKAVPAVAEWKLLKKQIAEVAKIQAVRLEQAMVTVRRWTPDEFQSLLVRHPLMIHLVRLLVWATYDGAGEVTATFRVTEDQTLADATDAPFTLGADARVGVVHPLQLARTPQVIEQWGQIFGDYEIVPPFAQLGRPTHSLTPEQRQEDEITHFAERGKLPAQTLVFGLEKLGWQRGIPQDAGFVYEHTKQFYGANITAVINYQEGFSVGYWEGAGEQTIERVFFISGLYTPRMYPEHGNVLPLADIDAIALSEVIADCEFLLAKAK